MEFFFYFPPTADTDDKDYAWCNFKSSLGNLDQNYFINH